jgi:hypothetical protein
MATHKHKLFVHVSPAQHCDVLVQLEVECLQTWQLCE